VMCNISSISKHWSRYWNIPKNEWIFVTALSLRVYVYIFKCAVFLISYCNRILSLMYLSTRKLIMRLFQRICVMF